MISKGTQQPKIKKNIDNFTNLKRMRGYQKSLKYQ